LNDLIQIVNFVTIVQSRKFRRIVKVASMYQNLHSVRTGSGAHQTRYRAG